MITTRQIGRWGTAARVVVGTGAVGWGAMLGADAVDLALGLVAMPAAVLIALAVRGRDARPLRLEAPWAHCLNIGIFVLLVNRQLEATLLVYGASMMLAAWQGVSACELFAVSNVLRRRDDQLGCPLFLPIDSAEAAFVRRSSRA